ncbi:hypothetical protein HPB51_023901 [Rhipicephalus microplus]|uniref:EF-hand domain-containing protein n=1 Tax=Rhipicephalus microplus TaxID=6941 RepID=A0A9J6DDI3_RHIMP|nr:hypothetical protein HPB51_023901 [Rhipicephalus microplus]
MRGSARCLRCRRARGDDGRPGGGEHEGEVLVVFVGMTGALRAASKVRVRFGRLANVTNVASVEVHPAPSDLASVIRQVVREELDHQEAAARPAPDFRETFLLRDLGATTTPASLMPVTIRLALECQAPLFIHIRVTSGMMTVHADHLPFFRSGMAGSLILLLKSVVHPVNISYTSTAASVAMSPYSAPIAVSRQHRPMGDRVHSTSARNQHVDETPQRKVVSESMLEELKECFMEAYDDNKDGKIEIRELAQLLPLEESFLLLFRFDNPLESSVEFMKIWREYDTDGSGYIEADELKNFLKDLLREAKKDSIEEDKLIEYTDTLLQIFDSNKDGKLQLSEMAKLLPVKENFLCRSAFKGASKLTREDIERVFALYDRDKNGTIENEELKGFLKDLLELVKKDYDAQDLEEFQEAILRGCDFNKDGKISKKELTMVLLALAKHSADEDGK